MEIASFLRNLVLLKAKHRMSECGASKNACGMKKHRGQSDCEEKRSMRLDSCDTIWIIDERGQAGAKTLEPQMR